MSWGRRPAEGESGESAEVDLRLKCMNSCFGLGSGIFKGLRALYEPGSSFLGDAGLKKSQA